MVFVFVDIVTPRTSSCKVEYNGEAVISRCDDQPGKQQLLLQPTNDVKLLVSEVVLLNESTCLSWDSHENEELYVMTIKLSSSSPNSIHDINKLSNITGNL